MKQFRFYYVILLLLVIAYATFIFSIPPDSAALTRYSLTAAQARLLNLTIIIPYVIIWFLGFYGFIKVKEYTSLITASRDGKAFKVLSDGLMLLATSLPLNALAANVRTYIDTQNESLTPTVTIVYNYFILVIALAGVWFVSHGARQLAGMVGKKVFGLGHALIAVAFVLFCGFYTYVALTDPLRNTPGGLSGRAAYYLPDFLVFSTIIIPYILLWYIGLRSAYHLRHYATNVPGTLYRKALSRLSLGIAFVVLSSMVLRLTTSLTSFLGDLSLRYLLIFVYCLLLIIGIGYALVASGAKRLKKIEEV